MTTFQEKFSSMLKNAERILEHMRHTHRQHIEEEESEEEENREAQADHTFESPHATLMDETKLKEHDEHQFCKPVHQKKWTVADKLELDFLRRTYQDYCADLSQIE